MLVHLALCLGLTYASNRALAALFHVRPHSESSLIAGLLLPPNTRWPGGAGTSSTLPPPVHL
ncbi:MAG: hypothetical protein NVS2B15_18670 [Pseudarthrobacter sp.]